METKYYEELFEKFIKIANMGYVKGKYILFVNESEYYEYMKGASENDGI